MKYYVFTFIANSIAFAKTADKTDNPDKSDDPGIIYIADSIQEDFLRLSEEEEKSSRCPKNFQTRLNYKNQNIDFDWVLNSGISGHLSQNRNGLEFLKIFDSKIFLDGQFQDDQTWKWEWSKEVFKWSLAEVSKS